MEKTVVASVTSKAKAFPRIVFIIIFILTVKIGI